MRTIHYSKYTIEPESIQSQLAAGRYNPAVTLTYRDKSGKHTVTLSSGTYDDVEVFRDGSLCLVLSSNSRLDYFGIEVFEAGSLVGDIFIQNGTEELDEWENMAPINLAKYLMQWIQ